MQIFQLLVLISLALQLGSPNYGVREKATSMWLVAYQLKAPQPTAVIPHPVLLWGTKHQDAEIAVRCKELIRKGREATVGKWLKSLGRLPWIDMIPRDHPDYGETSWYFLQLAREKVKQDGPPHWTDYRAATALYFEWLYLRGDADVAEKVLPEMEENERLWIKAKGTNYDPPLRMPGIWD